jgi:predicted PurR-regulated permease PerM
MEQNSTIDKYIAGVLIIALGVLIFSGLQEFFNAFLGSIIFYVLFKNFMRKLTKKYRLNRSLSAVIIIVITFFIVVLPTGLLLGMIYNKAAAVFAEPDEVKGFLNDLTDKLSALPIKNQAKNMNEKAVSFITSHIGGVLSSSLGVLGSLAIMYFFLFFFLIGEDKIESKLIYYLPFEKQTVQTLGKELEDQTFSNAIGTPVIAIVQGLITYGGYLIAGVPDAALWAIITGVSTIIPLIGTALIWVPISVVLLIQGHFWQGVFILSFCAIVVGTIDNLIRMLISKKIGDVHPIITVLGIIVGLKFFNLPGLVFGPLLISYFIIFLKLYYNHITKEKPVEANVTVTVNKGVITNIVTSIMRALNSGKK